MAVSHWLIKSEPSTYSYDQLVRDKNTVWDGIRNYAARNHLRAMKKGDLLLFYHSGEAKEIAAIAKVRKEAYPDPSTDEDWSVVDIEPVTALKAPVPLAVIRAHAVLGKMQMIKQGRLSVMPVTSEEFRTVLTLSKTKL